MVTKKKEPLSGKSRRVKGHNFERGVARALQRFFPDARRGVDQTQDGRQPDVDGTPWFIECKAGKRVNFMPAMAQAESAAKAADDGRPAIVVGKVDRIGVFALMRFDEFMRLLLVMETAVEAAYLHDVKDESE